MKEPKEISQQVVLPLRSRREAGLKHRTAKERAMQAKVDRCIEAIEKFKARNDGQCPLEAIAFWQMLTTNLGIVLNSRAGELLVGIVKELEGSDTTVIAEKDNVHR